MEIYKNCSAVHQTREDSSFIVEILLASQNSVLNATDMKWDLKKLTMSINALKP